MSLEQLESQREEICLMMIEAEGVELKELEEELMWIEELIQMELQNGEENY